MRLVQVLDDRKRLGKPRAVIELERGQQRLRIDFRVPRRPVLALGQVHEQRLVGEPLQMERDANAKCGGAAKVGIKLHNAGSIFTFSSPTPSMPACISSPALTGPTPAGVPE